MAAIGVSVEDYEAERAVEVWPDNWDATDVMLIMATQWRTANGSPTGLDYNVLPLAMRAARIDESRTGDVLNDLRVMEDEAMKIMLAKKS
jgi:hypothetical protein